VGVICAAEGDTRLDRSSFDHCPERETRSDVGDMREASHLGAVDSLIIADIGCNDMDEIVEVAGHEMTADDFGYRCDRRLKFVEMILVLTVERDLDEDRGAEPDPLAVDCGVVATDDAGGLKSANAAQTGAGGEVDPFGNGGVCHAPVALE
jgi:hypothetical protein